MKSLNYLQQYVLLTLAIMLLIIAFIINDDLSKPLIIVSKQDQTWNLNDKMVQNFNLGFKRLGSSFLWISTILDSDIDHYKKKDLNSWMFRRFNSISILEPLFYENYSFGGQYLSIVKDDLSGASIIYNLGLSHYGNDFRLLRDAGFHFYFEVEDYKRAYEIYSKLKIHPKASPIMISTLARLENAQGNSESAFSLLLNQYNHLQDKTSLLAEKIRMNLYALKSEVDLNCLNSALSNKKVCSMKDFDGNLYIWKNQSYQSAKAWTSFKIKRKK